MADRHGPRESNRLLIAARHAKPSTLVPGYCMTRAELAEALNLYLSAKSGKEHSSIDSTHVGRWERGEVRWPIALHREALRAVLGVAVDAELGFTPRPGQGNADTRVPLRPRPAFAGGQP